MPQLEPIIVERRPLGRLVYLTLHSPELARAARPGQYLLVRCAPPGAYDPLLRRALFLADADHAAGTVALLVDPAERGLAWLAAQPPGARLDSIGPLGAAVDTDGRTRNLLLAGGGACLPALFFACRAAVARGVAVVLLAAADAPDAMPPPYLLPPEVEYQSTVEGEQALAALLRGAPPAPDVPPKGKKPAPVAPSAPPPLLWADQLVVAVGLEAIPALIDAVRAVKLRWERGFAQAILAGPMPCGTGACQACLIETRDGLRTRCKDGPVFDLRELR